ncbi:hypothetical protein FKP32DRAFT_1604517 [Trametes sanguinea]|nr:hypothetical protein FKP32DRAFT_1604517 [Trametes sanguinea]
MCELAGITLLAYDHLLTLSGEIRFVWDRKFSCATVVFVLNRYVNLFSMIILPISTFWWPEQSNKSCKAPVILTEILTVIAYFVAAVFSALRVYAIWNLDWRPLGVVLLIGICIPINNMYHHIRSVPTSFDYPLYGCGEDVALTPKQLQHCAIAVDLLVLVLTWIKTYEIKKLTRDLPSKTTFSTFILRDVLFSTSNHSPSKFFDSTLLALNVADLIVLRSDVLFDPLPVLINAFTCILISRFMLNLRQVAEVGTGNPSSALGMEALSRMSTVRFATNLVGDLGSHLAHEGWNPESDGQYTEAQAFAGRDHEMDFSCNALAADRVSPVNASAPSSDV